MSDESRLPDIQKKIPYPFTAVPNSYLDEWMRTLGKKPNAKLAMIYIFRRTVGWEGRPIEAAITLKEFRAFIGIEHDATVETALAVLKDAGLITIRQEGGSKSVKLYRLTPKAFQSAKIEDTHPQNVQIGTAKNRRNSSSKIAEATSPQLAQEEASAEAKEKKEKGKENEKRAWHLRMQIGKLEDDLGKLHHSRLRTWAGKTESQLKDEIRTLRAKLSGLEAVEDESAPRKDKSEG